jgi:hypothetical protein
MSNPTGGFDLCVEVSEAFLNSNISSKFGNTKQNFPIGVTVDGHTIKGNASLFIDQAGMTIDPAVSPNGKITIHFVDSALTVSSPVTADAMPLAGSIVASVPFKLSTAAGKPPSRTLELDFTDPSINPTVVPDPGPTMDNIVQAVAKVLGVPSKDVPPSQVTTMLGEAMKSALASDLGAFKLPGVPPFVVATAGKDNLGPPPQFQTDMTLKTLPAAGDKPGVLCFLGTVFQGDMALDIPASKTAAVTAANQQASITVSPQAVQSTLDHFVSLPQGLTATATLENQQIAVHLGGSISETGCTITITGDATITLSLNNGVLTPHVTASQHISIDLDWWVWLLSVFVPEIQLIGGIPMLAVMDVIANNLVNEIVNNLLSRVVGEIDSTSVQTGELTAPFTFDSISIEPTGITAQATAPIATPSTATTVRGIVTDAATETPIAGASVYIEDLQGQVGPIQLTTDSSGMYQSDVVAGDWQGQFTAYPYMISVTQNDYSSQTLSNVTFAENQTNVKDFALQKVMPFTLKGLVVAASGGAPLAGATVTLDGYSNDTDTTKPDGSYSFTVNPGQYNGSYSASATATGYQDQTDLISAIANGATVVHNFDMIATHPFTVSGQVTGLYGPAGDASDGPIAGATVTVFAEVVSAQPGQTYKAQTDAQGNYSVAVNPGTYGAGYKAMAEAKLFEEQTVDLPQPTGNSVTQDFSLSQPPSKIPVGGGVKPGTAM